MTIRFHPGLRMILPQKTAIDVLYYGQVSERRQQLLNALATRCRLQVIRDVYGVQRDAYIARSKIVLNIHRYEAPIFEQVRVSYLLNNSRCVVSEDSPYNPYRGMIVTAEYGAMADVCLSLLRDDERRERLVSEGAKRFEAMPMREILARAIGVDTNR
jgi:hypothetical protein